MVLFVFEYCAVAGADEIAFEIFKQNFAQFFTQGGVWVHARHQKRRKAVELFLFFGKAFYVYENIAAEQKPEFFAHDYRFAFDVPARAFEKLEGDIAERFTADNGKRFIIFLFADYDKVVGIESRIVGYKFT